MCQMIVKPEGKIIPRDALDACFRRNPDGAGFTYIEKDREGKKKLRMLKGFMEFDKFYEVYQKYEQSLCLIHFRMASHGTVCTENCHPFFVTPDIAMAHNGVLFNFTPIGKDERSDTKIFADEYIRPIILSISKESQVRWLPNIKHILEPMISGNKLVFITTEGFVIVKEGLGEWDSGVWYSNGVPTRHFYAGRDGNWYNVWENGNLWRRWIDDDDRKDYEGRWDDRQNGMVYKKKKHPLALGMGMRGGAVNQSPASDSTDSGEDKTADEVIDAAIKIGEEEIDVDMPPDKMREVFAARDEKILHGMQLVDDFKKERVSEKDYFEFLGVMDAVEFTEFLNVFTEDDPESEQVLRADRKTALKMRMKARKRGNGRNHVSLEENGRIFKVDGTLMSRSAARKLFPHIDLPNGQGLWDAVFQIDGNTGISKVVGWKKETMVYPHDRPVAHPNN